MKEIILNKGKVLLMDDADYEELGHLKWYAAPSGAGKNGHNPYRKYFYVARHVKKADGKRTLEFLHRRLINAQPGQVCDHINRNTLDNRRGNLRIVTTSQNAANSDHPRCRRSSKYRGVSPSGSKKNKWRAGIGKRIEGKPKNYYLGCFDTEKKAALAYDKKAKELFGEFARLNFPEVIK